MFVSRYEILKCSSCKNELDKPFECLNCNNLYCSKCINYCYNCKSESFQINKAIYKLLKQSIFPCKECRQNFNSKHDLLIHYQSKTHNTKNQCIFCSKNFTNNFEFLEHINNFHLHTVLDIFNKHSLYNNSYGENLKQLINSNKKNNIDELILDNKSLSDNEEKKSLDNQEFELKNIDNISNYEKISEHNKNININLRCNTEENERKNLINIIDTKLTKKKEENIQQPFDTFSATISAINPRISIYNYDNSISKSVLNDASFSIAKLYRCMKKKLKCFCCSDGICKTGNCFCETCMKRNKANLNLNQYQLINKGDRICTLSKGKYYCGVLFIDDKVSFYNHTEQFKCIYPRECPACKDLNKNLEIYNNI